MTNELFIPENLHEAIKYFADPDKAHSFFIAFRWPAGVTCPQCGGKEHSYISTRRTWACKECKKRFTAKVGTVLESSPLSLEIWMAATWMIVGAKNGISSCEIARALGVTQKTAWFLLHRIRFVLTQGTFEKFAGTIEVDETFIGGKEKNKHSDKKLNAGRGGVGKEIVLGILKRGEEVRAKVIPDTTKETLHAEVKANVETGSEVFTDAHRGYLGLSPELDHQWVDHAVKYAEGRVHSNGVENFWSLFDRMLGGTYTHVDPRHLQSYIDEEVYRFNQRKGNDAERFIMALAGTPGKRLTYQELTERGLATMV